MLSEKSFAPKQEKPPVLFHASRDTEIAVLNQEQKKPEMLARDQKYLPLQVERWQGFS